jgi:hypothetical protein
MADFRVSLGGEHRHVRSPDDLAGGIVLEGEQADADPRAELMLDTANRHRGADPIHDAARNARCSFRTRQMSRKDSKLVTAKACNHISGSRGGDNSLGDDCQGFIARALAVDVVDLLDAAQIQDQQRMRALGAGRRGDGGFECIIECGSIGEAGQRILQ